MLLLLVSHGVVPGRGPVVSAQAVAASTNETAKSATSARMRRDMRTSANQGGKGTTLEVPTWVRRVPFIRVFLRHRRAVLRHVHSRPCAP